MGPAVALLPGQLSQLLQCYEPAAYKQLGQEHVSQAQTWTLLTFHFSGLTFTSTPGSGLDKLWGVRGYSATLASLWSSPHPYLKSIRKVEAGVFAVVPPLRGTAVLVLKWARTMHGWSITWPTITP